MEESHPQHETHHSFETLQSATWEAPEYDHFKKSADWYWSLWIIALSLTVTAVIFKNILLAVLLILSAFSITIFSHRKPKIVKFMIDHKGVLSGETLYPYKTLDSFGIETHRGPRGKLLLKSKSKLAPYIVIPIEKAVEEELRYLLSAYLPEEEHRESIFVKMLEYLGF